MNDQPPSAGTGELACIVLILVGPKEADIIGLRDLLASMTHYESPATWRAVLVEDRANPAHLRSVVSEYQPSILEVMPNPRPGDGDDWAGSLILGVVTGLQWIARHAPPARFILKLDTDSLVIKPFHRQISEYFIGHPQVGIAGSCQNWPGGRGPNGSQAYWIREMRKLPRLLWVWRTVPHWHWHFAWQGRARQVRRSVLAALANGYRLGENCQGGGYALSRDCLLAMEAAGYLQDPWTFYRYPISEDVIVSLLARAAGFTLADFNQRGEPFGVQWRGLCATPPGLVDEGYAIIHSVKGRATEVDEQAVRRFFAGRREAGRCHAQG